MNVYTFAWLMWGAFFAVIEASAILRKRPGATLSEHIWQWFAIRGKPGGYKARRAVLVMSLAWLVGHFLTGGAI